MNDPDEALKNARAARDDLMAAQDAVTLHPATVALMESFHVLDDWLVRGGFLPRNWQQRPTAKLRKALDAERDDDGR